MKSSLGKRGSLHRQDGRCEVFAERGLGWGRGRRRDRWMHDVAHVVRKDVEQPLTICTDASGSNPFLYSRFVQLSQAVVVSVRMGSTDSRPLSGRLGDETNRISLSLSVEVVSKRVLEITAEREDLVLPLNDYKVWKENFWLQRIRIRRYCEGDCRLTKQLRKRRATRRPF